eukprot:3903813-Pleurochrysis_carterae.AAC.7
MAMLVCTSKRFTRMLFLGASNLLRTGPVRVRDDWTKRVAASVILSRNEQLRIACIYSRSSVYIWIMPHAFTDLLRERLSTGQLESN